MEVSVRTSFFLKSLRSLKLKKNFILFSVFYFVSGLIVPFATQYLVNNLTVAGIHINTVTFIVILLLALTISQTFKYCQVVLNEYLQREIYYIEIQRWTAQGNQAKAPYFFEIMNSMKSFSISFSHLVELMLLLIFGSFIIIIFHPAFIVLLFILAATLWGLFYPWKQAISTSLEESNEKYSLYYLKTEGAALSDAAVDQFLIVRNEHFYFIKRNKLLVGITYVLTQLILLSMGIYFVQLNQLSIGQLVSAEIILSGILGSLMRLPKTLESLYDFETSMIKIDRALGESNG